MSHVGHSQSVSRIHPVQVGIARTGPLTDARALVKETQEALPVAVDEAGRRGAQVGAGADAEQDDEEQRRKVEERRLCMRSGISDLRSVLWQRESGSTHHLLSLLVLFSLCVWNVVPSPGVLSSTQE